MKKKLPAFCLGLLATSLQVFFLREFNAYFYGNELTFGIVLASWLLWGGLGSLAAGRARSLPDLSKVTFIIILVFPFALAAIRLSRLFFRILPGEMVGWLPLLVMSMGVCAIVSFPLGALFVANVNRRGGDIRRIYIWESLGAATAGPTVHVLLGLFSSSWTAAAVVSAAVALLVHISDERRLSPIWTAAVVAALAGLGIADLPIQKAYWRPLELIASRDSRYGRLQVVRISDQLTLYNNNSPVVSLPDIASAEESVHFAMLQKPEALRILLVGGGAGQTIGEALKYPKVRVDFVELDADIIRMYRRYLDPKEREILDSTRVRIILKDGRAFLQRTVDEYDIIILNLPEPATAQSNRFYTREFFELAGRRLQPGGVFSFSIPSSENVIGPELREVLTSLYATLSAVFPQVEVIPGSRNIFLASADGLTIDPEELSRRISALGLSLRYLEARTLQSRLHPLRIEYLNEILAGGPRRINSDLAPVSFFLQGSFWSSQFRGPEGPVLEALSKLPPLWLLGGPLLLFSLLLVILRWTKNETSFSLIPLAVMGLTSIAIEIVLLIWFQALYGYLYGRVALLLSTFMLGLFLGASLRTRAPNPTFAQLAAVQAAFVVLLAAFRTVIPLNPPELVAFLILMAFGLLGGRLFVISNLLFLRIKTDYGRGYGIDLIGSFAGALVTASLLIPLAGLPRVVEALIILNAVSVVFLIVRPKSVRHSC